MTLLLVYATVSIFFSFLCSILEAVLLSVTSTHINLKKKEGYRYASILEELKKDVDFIIQISNDENSISIISEVKNNISSDYNLAVCLTESNIENWQKDGQENIENYQHNHVLRTVLIDEQLSNSSNYISGQQIEALINYDLANLEQYNIDYSTNTAELGNGNAGDWNASNMSVIAYIYNTNTKEILQVEEAHLNN